MREEIEILKKLKHENIVLLLDSFETNQEFVIITELGQGELFNIIEDDQFLPETEVSHRQRRFAGSPSSSFVRCITCTATALHIAT